MKKWTIIIGAALVAAWLVADTVREFVANETIRYFSREPHRLLYVAAVAVIGGFSALGFARLSPRTQRHVRIFAWGAAASTLTTFVGYFAFHLASVSPLVVQSGGNAQIAVALLLFSAITVYLWFELYRTWNTGPSTDHAAMRQCEAALPLVRILALILISHALAGCRPDRAASESCLYKLKTLAMEKAIWEAEEQRDTNAVPTLVDLFGTNINDSFVRKRMTCPEGGTLTIGRVGEPPRCSLPMHGVNFGWVIVQDSNGVPVEGAEVFVLGGVTGAERALTDTKGIARVTRFPASVVDEWSRRATGIAALRAGFHSATSSLPASWPVKVTVRKNSK